jgi:ATP adenylyltransferase
LDILWSPWRMAYINADSAGAGGSAAGAANTDEAPPAARAAPSEPPAEVVKCIFCRYAGQAPAHDRANLLLLRGAQCFVILNRYPYNSAHLMIVPYRHLHDVTRLSAEECGEMMALLQRMVAALDAEYHPQGFNVGMNLGATAGAGIADHLHMHVVPRWTGDTNFMPVVGQTKVLPEALEQTYDRLKTRLDQM